MDTEYASQLARARTMLAALNAMIEHHARDAEQRDDGHFAAELEALCTKLGEAAICITPVEFPR